MAGLKLSLLADVRQFVRSFKQAGASVEDLGDELVEMERDGEHAVEGIEKKLRDLPKEADKAGKKTAANLKEGFDDAKGEAGQSAREAAASFSGGFEDVADMVQETLANALGGFGPAGAAAGIALAVGIGSALQGLADQQERLEQVRDAAADLASTLYSNKGALPLEEAIDSLFSTLTRERKAQGVESFIDQWADFGTVLDAVKRTATATRIPVRNLVQALSGTDIAESRRQLEAVTDQLDEMLKTIRTASPDEALRMQGTINDLLAVQTELKGVIGQSELAREAMGAVGSSFDSEQVREQIRSLGEAWQENAVDASDYWTETEEGAKTFDWKTYLSNAESALRAANDYKRKIVGLPPSIRAEAERVFREQGAQAAVGYIDSFAKASAKDKQRFIDVAAANGDAAGKAQGKSMANAAHTAARAAAQGMGPIPVTFKPETTQLDRWLRNYRPTVYSNLVINPNGMPSRNGRTVYP